jgi:hypothetical protein
VTAVGAIGARWPVFVNNVELRAKDNLNCRDVLLEARDGIDLFKVGCECFHHVLNYRIGYF